MLLAGFSWIIIACIAGMIITKVVPGTWEQRGPTVIMLTSVAAAFSAMMANLVMEGINAFGPPSGGPASYALVGISTLGALIAFVAYVVDVRKQQPAA
jgi:hypothetical protein